MRRLLLVVALAGWALPASAQTCVTINGVTRCAAPWQIYDTTVRQLSLPVIDLRQTWNAPGVTFTGWKLNITDTNSASTSLLMDLQVGGVSQFSITKAGVLSSGATSALGTTSTDGFTLQNTTASNATTTVQMSPRLKWCGSAWNSTSLASETDCWFIENLPATVAGTTTSTLKFGSTIAGGAATYPFTITSAGAAMLGDGTAAAPSLTFASATNRGFYNDVANAAVAVSAGGAEVALFNASGLLLSSDSVTLRFGGSADLVVARGAAGRVNITNSGSTIGSSIKVDALPTVTSCGAGSPAVVAGSTPFSGAVTIGTTSVATCTITFNGTAFPSAPHCSGSVETSTAANARAMGYSASTTALVIVPSAAWADSSVVNWTCISSK